MGLGASLGLGLTCIQLAFPVSLIAVDTRGRGWTIQHSPWLVSSQSNGTEPTTQSEAHVCQHQRSWERVKKCTVSDLSPDLWNQNLQVTHLHTEVQEALSLVSTSWVTAGSTPSWTWFTNCKVGVEIDSYSCTLRQWRIMQ